MYKLATWAIANKVIKIAKEIAVKQQYSLIPHCERVVKSEFAAGCNSLRHRTLVKKLAFSLVEMLMALLVASLLMAALAPVMTKRMNENIGISIEGTIPGKKVKTHNITYEDCINSGGTEKEVLDNNGKVVSKYCEGEFTIPAGFNGTMTVTAIGAGGGGGAAATAGYTDYKTASNSHGFTVPAIVNEAEVTLVGGGAGGGAGWINTDIKGYAWTFSGILDRNFVPESAVGEKVENIKVSGGNSVSSTYSHGEATLSSDNTKYIANGKIYVSMAGGGGGGGQGTLGTGGGGGAAYKREGLVIANGNSYLIKVGAGGRSRACNGLAGCGGSASSFGSFLQAGGGGGGSWGWHNGGPDVSGNGSKGENGGAETGIQECLFANNVKPKYGTGGNGAAPGGNNAPNLECNNAVSADCVPGGNGGGSMFGLAGIYSYVASTDTRHGQGYGGGGCGSGAWGHVCSSVPTGDIGDTHAGNGAPGFVAAEWHEIANGGGGGGAGAMVPHKRIEVSPGEVLTIVVGAGGKGGTAGYVNSLGNITAPKNGTSGVPSLLMRGNTELIRTSADIGADGQTCHYGACKGDTKGRCGDAPGCALGWISGGYNKTTNTVDGEGSDFYREKINGIEYMVMKNTKFPGYKTYGGNAAGNHAIADKYGYQGVLSSSDGGGDGGRTLIGNVETCGYGKGSTAINMPGGSATGYGGCGGGGGYGVTNGGDGVQGYARISWNKYWNTEKENNGEYELNNAGAGGGGASGNIMKLNITVKSGEKLKYRIGKGGEGAYIVATSGAYVVEATNGGETVFAYGTNKAIKAGGGGGGKSPFISENNSALVNGTAGSISNICHFNNVSKFDTSDCKKGGGGSHPVENKGGDGGSLVFDGKTIGTGGKAKAAGRGDTNGEDGKGYGAGGAGASLRDVDYVSSSEAIANPTKGGSGRNGMIELRWEE